MRNVCEKFVELGRVQPSLGLQDRELLAQLPHLTADGVHVDPERHLREAGVEDGGEHPRPQRLRDPVEARDRGDDLGWRSGGGREPR